MLGTGIIYIYQLSYEILKQRETIGTYQLLGMRKFEIWRIYVYKSGMIALIGFVCAVYYHFADIYLNYGLNLFYTYTFLVTTSPISFVYLEFDCFIITANLFNIKKRWIRK